MDKFRLGFLHGFFRSHPFYVTPDESQQGCEFIVKGAEPGGFAGSEGDFSSIIRTKETCPLLPSQCSFQIRQSECVSRLIRHAPQENSSGDCQIGLRSVLSALAVHVASSAYDLSGAYQAFS
jgi:hypothetical protein